MQRRQLRIQLRGPGAVAGARRRAHLMHQPGRDVAGHRDHAGAAQQQGLPGGGVVAAEEQELAAAARAQFPEPFLVTQRLLDADDGFALGRDPRRGLGQQVAGGAAGHIVKNLRNRGGGGDGAVVLVQALLGRLVVVRGHQQAGVRARLLGGAGQRDGLGGGVGAGAGDHRQPPRGPPHHPADDRVVLGDVERRRFAGGADRHQRVAALLQVEVDQPVEGRVVDRARRVHGRGQRHHAAAERHAGARPVAVFRTPRSSVGSQFRVVFPPRRQPAAALAAES